jgi:hypothetical protein
MYRGSKKHDAIGVCAPWMAERGFMKILSRGEMAAALDTAAHSFSACLPQSCI